VLLPSKTRPFRRSWDHAAPKSCACAPHAEQPAEIVEPAEPVRRVERLHLVERLDNGEGCRDQSQQHDEQRERADKGVGKQVDPAPSLCPPSGELSLRVHTVIADLAPPGLVSYAGYDPLESLFAVSDIALMASATLIDPVAAACRLVYTARENSGYHDGAPSGKTGLAVFLSMSAS